MTHQEEARNLEGDGRLPQRQRIAQHLHHLGSCGAAQRSAHSGGGGITKAARPAAAIILRQRKQGQ